MTTRPLVLWAALLVTPMLGCANSFLKGGQMATQDHAQGARGSYRIAGCTKVADNSPVEAPASTYHLFDFEGKPALFERDAAGKGVVISNHWSDAAGDHYYVGVTSNGWEFVFPQGGGNASRVVYNAVSTSQNPDGSVRPVSPPMARCELVSSGS
jgi:hypothetical protein